MLLVDGLAFGYNKSMTSLSPDIQLIAKKLSYHEKKFSKKEQQVLHSLASESNHLQLPLSIQYWLCEHYPDNYRASKTEAFDAKQINQYLSSGTLLKFWWKELVAEGCKPDNLLESLMWSVFTLPYYKEALMGYDEQGVWYVHPLLERFEPVVEHFTGSSPRNAWKEQFDARPGAHTFSHFFNGLVQPNNWDSIVLLLGIEPTNSPLSTTILNSEMMINFRLSVLQAVQFGHQTASFTMSDLPENFLD